jgi:hypothetical protein
VKYAIRPVECEGNDLILRIQRGGRDSAALRLRHLGAARGGPGNPFDSQPPGLTALVAVSVHAVRGASSPSVAHENSQLLTQSAVNQWVAERTRIVNLVQSPLEGSGKRL